MSKYVLAAMVAAFATVSFADTKTEETQNAEHASEHSPEEKKAEDESK